MELSVHQQVLGLAFLIAAAMGAVVNKTNFCTMGAVSDWVNMEDTGRLRAWLLAIAVATGSLVLLEGLGKVSLGEMTFPPYRSANLSWLRNILGGLLFGVGMTLASGCGNKTLIRIGGGNLKSLVVLAIAGACAWSMLWTDFYRLAFDSWLSPLSLNLARFGMKSQTLDGVLGGLVGMEPAGGLRLTLGALVSAGLAAFAFSSAEFRGHRDNILGGVAVGLAVAAGWYVTGGSLGQGWKEWAEMADTMPSRVEVQSLTFISPMGDGIRYLMDAGNVSLVNFGICSLAGVVTGSFLYSIATRSFRLEWFPNFKDFLTHAAGAVLMGIGGVLAMGCTIGQGITGFSTLALGSMLTLVAIVAGSAGTMKLQYRFM